MPLFGALRHFFTFIFCEMSTPSFVRKCRLPREDFLSPRGDSSINDNGFATMVRVGTDSADIVWWQVVTTDYHKLPLYFKIWIDYSFVLRHLTKNYALGGEDDLAPAVKNLGQRTRVRDNFGPAVNITHLGTLVQFYTQCWGS